MYELELELEQARVASNGTTFLMAGSLHDGCRVALSFISLSFVSMFYVPCVIKSNLALQLVAVGVGCCWLLLLDSK